MRISLNLATRPFADVGPLLEKLRIAMAVLAVIALALGYGVYALDQKAQIAREKVRVLDEHLARLNRERQGYQAMMREPDNAAVLAQAENLNQLFDEKAFSWTLAMEDLETVLPGGVQVTTLEPTRDKDGHITLRLRVVGARDRSIQLVENLEHSRRFVNARIVGENSESQTGPNQRMEPVSAANRVNFDLLADYIPAKPGERRPVRATGEPRSSRPRTGGEFPMPPRATRTPYTGMASPIPGQRAPSQPRPQPRSGGPQ
jgi:type IV pilus assembly protein PilN